jgi:5-methylcytosine-specific restriction endonuclease McrA
MTAAMRKLVRERAGERCEYCRLPQSALPFATFHVEHVIAIQHGGSDEDLNLALACDRCNAFKGSNLSGVDPETESIVRLFNRRSDTWQDHFVAEGTTIVGRTVTGRATVHLLQMNARRRQQLRAELGLNG